MSSPQSRQESTAELHPAITAMVSLAAAIAGKHPDMGQCQRRRLRDMGITEGQIATVVEIASHIRDEAGQQLDAVFDNGAQQVADESPAIGVAGEASACCSSTASGTRCC